MSIVLLALVALPLLGSVGLLGAGRLAGSGEAAPAARASIERAAPALATCAVRHHGTVRGDDAVGQALVVALPGGRARPALGAGPGAALPPRDRRHLGAADPAHRRADLPGLRAPANVAVVSAATASGPAPAARLRAWRSRAGPSRPSWRSTCCSGSSRSRSCWCRCGRSSGSGATTTTSRPARCGDAVRAVHGVRLDPAAAGDPVGVRGRRHARHRCADRSRRRRHGARCAGHRRRADGHRPHGQGADLAAAHLAAAGAHGRADGRVGPAGRRPAQARHLRSRPPRRSRCAARVLGGGALPRSARCRRHRLGWPGLPGRARPQATCRLLLRRPHGLRGGRHRVGQRPRSAGRAVCERRPRPGHRPALPRGRWPQGALRRVRAGRHRLGSARAAAAAGLAAWPSVALRDLGFRAWPASGARSLRRTAPGTPLRTGRSG